MSAVESPDQGWADSGKDSPVQTEDSGKNSSPHEDSPTPVMGHDGKSTKTVIPAVTVQYCGPTRIASDKVEKQLSSISKFKKMSINK